MLVLTRKPGQTVLIDGQIEVKVLSVRGNAVQLGIAAPTSMPIVRPEATEPYPGPPCKAA